MRYFDQNSFKWDAVRIIQEFIVKSGISFLFAHTMKLIKQFFERANMKKKEKSVIEQNLKNIDEKTLQLFLTFQQLSLS